MASWLPDREQDFVDLCEKWKAAFKEQTNITAFGWDMDAVTEAMSAIHIFLTARAAYEENNSTKNRQAKDEAKEAAMAAMRDFANTSIRYNKKMRDEDKAVFGIKAPDRTPTAVTEINSYPEAEGDTSVLRQVTIHFWDNVTKKRGKPHGVHGAEIRWALLDRPPASVEELTKSDFDTASPLTLKFDESDRGKRLYFCPRWETKTNIKGPFGEIYSSIIP